MDPNEIVQARRIAAWAVRSPSHGVIKPGDIIPMRRAEAEGRPDFEVVEPEPETEKGKTK